MQRKEIDLMGYKTQSMEIYGQEFIEVLSVIKQFK